MTCRNPVNIRSTVSSIEYGWYTLGIIDEDILRQKVGTFFLSHLNYLKGRGKKRFIKRGFQPHTHTHRYIYIYTQRSPGSDLVYVLAEGWDGGELADEVEVGGGEGVNSTAVKDGQSLVSRQSQILQ